MAEKKVPRQDTKAKTQQAEMPRPDNRAAAQLKQGSSSARLEKALQDYRCESSPDNLQRVVQAGSRLVRYFARLYAGQDPAEDLLQVGFEGLLKAVQRFDPGRGVSFATYASHGIMGAMRHHIRKENQYYRPGCITDLQNRVSRLIEQTLQETGEMPTVSEIAGALNVKEEGITEVMRSGLVSLEEVDWSKISHQRYESFQLPIEDRLILEQVQQNLSALHGKIIYMRFFQGFTQQETADKLGLSQRMVSRLQKKILSEMEEALRALQFEF